MRTVIVLICLVGIVSCNQFQGQKKTTHFPSGSRWTFIKKSNKVNENYAEIVFSNNSTLLIHSEIDGQIGPLQYKESENVLTFNEVDFSITNDANGFTLLRNDNQEFMLYSIPFREEEFDFYQIDPFYLRRCYFLVNLNVITTDSAIKYLSGIITTPQDSIPEDDIILTNQK